MSGPVEKRLRERNKFSPECDRGRTRHGVKRLYIILSGAFARMEKKLFWGLDKGFDFAYKGQALAEQGNVGSRLK